MQPGSRHTARNSASALQQERTQLLNAATAIGAEQPDAADGCAQGAFQRTREGRGGIVNIPLDGDGISIRARQCDLDVETFAGERNARVVRGAVIDHVVETAADEVKLQAVFSQGILHTKPDCSINAAIVHVEADGLAHSHTAAECADGIRDATAVVDAPGLAAGVDVVPVVGGGFAVVIIRGRAHVE